MNVRFANSQIFITMISMHFRGDLNMRGVKKYARRAHFCLRFADLSFGGAPFYSLGARVPGISDVGNDIDSGPEKIGSGGTALTGCARSAAFA
jgi:hypothetical protein